MTARYVREGVDFDHAKPPAGIVMPEPSERVELANGRQLEAAKARVCWLLVESLRLGLRYHFGEGQFGQAGEVPTWVLRHMWCGGTSGDRRARDLRDDGLPLVCPGLGSAGMGYLWNGPTEGVRIVAAGARKRATKRHAGRARSPISSGSAGEDVSPLRRPAPLEGVRVAVLWPHEDGTDAVELMSTRLRPSSSVVSDAWAGRIAGWDLDARYREELEGLGADLQLELRHLEGRELYCPRLGQWTPATVVRGLLEALGARAA